MKAIVLLGPTAVGKTEVSIELAGNLFDIISVDSVQVYKYLDIGSSKPSIDERIKIKHYLIDIVDPDYSFTAGDFCRYALEAANEISKQKKMPLFVGGTGLYVDSFFKGISKIPEIESFIRDDLFDELEVKGLDSLYTELLEKDPVFAEKIHRNDKQRILRGLEVLRGTGNPISSYYKTVNAHGSSETLFLGLYEEREILRKRIDERLDIMLKHGFVEEVENIKKLGFGPELKSMRTIGYNEINQYLDGKIDFDKAVELVKTNTKKYAKRQMTWFRKNKNINWFKKESIDTIIEIVNKWVD